MLSRGLPQSHPGWNYFGRVTDPEPPVPDKDAGQIQPTRPARWKLTLVVSGILVIQIANWIASASFFALIDKHPLWLVLLQPTTKNLLVVAEHISLVTFF